MNSKSGVEVMRIIHSKYFLIFCFIPLLIQGELSGQQKDFQTWWEFSIDKGLKNGIDLSAEIEQRFENNSLQYDRSLVTIAGEIDIGEYLNVAAGVRAYMAANKESQLNAKYRIQADATGLHTLFGIDVSLRARFQYGFEDVFNSGRIADYSFANRYRLKVENRIFGTRFEWFGSVESWHIFSGRPGFFHKMRFSAGIEYNLNFRSQFGIRYLLEDEFNVVNPLQSHILVFGFSHSL